MSCSFALPRNGASRPVTSHRHELRIVTGGLAPYRWHGRIAHKPTDCVGGSAPFGPSGASFLFHLALFWRVVHNAAALGGCWNGSQGWRAVCSRRISTASFATYSSTC